jgi:hypothetical protein
VLARRSRAIPAPQARLIRARSSREVPLAHGDRLAVAISRRSRRRRELDLGRGRWNASSGTRSTAGPEKSAR